VSGNDPNCVSAAELFELLWETLADVLGTAATATLLRRSIKQAAARTAWTEPVIVARDGLDYTYRLPEAWNSRPTTRRSTRSGRSPPSCACSSSS